MKITNKITLGFALTVFISVLICLGGSFHLKGMSNQYKDQIDQEDPILECLHDILIGGLRTIGATSEIVMLRESRDTGLKLKDKAIADEMTELQGGYRVLVEYLEKYNEQMQASTPENAKKADAVVQAVDRLVNSSIDLVEMKEGLSDRVVLELKEELEEADDIFTKIITEVILDAERDLADEHKEKVALNDKIQLVLFGLVLLAIITGITSVILILKTFTSGMALLSGASEKIAQGDFELEFDKKRTDEFGELAGEFEKMAREISSARTLADWSLLKIEKYAAGLKAKSKEYEEFVFVASHDLQEPLRKIMTYSSRVRKGIIGKVDEEYEDFITKIIETSAYLREKLDMLAEYSQIVVSEDPFEKVCLDEVTGNVVNRYRSIMGSGTTFDIGTLPTIDGRSDQLEKLFNCLFDNSFKFAGEKALEVKVSSDVIDEENYCRIIFEDNGSGFDQKYAGAIFRVFHSLDQERFGGVGMGLAIVKRIVEVHGGSISVESDFGSGAKFTMIFPIRQDGCLNGLGYIKEQQTSYAGGNA